MRAWCDRVSGATRRRETWSRRALAELEALDRVEHGPRDLRALERRGVPRRRLGLATVGVVAVLLWAPLAGLDAGPPQPGGVWVPEFVRGTTDRPDDARRERLLPAPRVPESRAFALMREPRDAKVPVTYDPCVPIHVEINPRTGGQDAVSLVEEALDEIRTLTGLEFVVDGLTDRTPELDDEVRRDELEFPVLVAWTDPQEVPDLVGATAGLGGSVAVRSRSGDRYVTGQVALDGPALATFSELDRSAVIRHELGHLVGLAHVDDPGELMFAQTTGVTQWGPGDRYGLALLGSGRCD